MLALSVGGARGAEPARTPEALVAEIQQALAGNEIEQALKLANQAVEANPNDARARLLRAHAREQNQDFSGASEDFTAVIEREGPELDVKSKADLHHRRGDAQLFAGKFAEAVEDFDEEIAAIPSRAAGHWQRGIACYYAGKFDEGAKQFDAYQKVDTNDVENSVWWFLCRAKTEGLETARGGLLPIGRDTRVPLMTVYELFRDRAKPDDVLAAIETGSPDPQELKRRLFYAHLYLGLWHEAHDRPKESLEHMRLAADEYNIGGYMWQVAKLHHELRQGGAASSRPAAANP